MLGPYFEAALGWGSDLQMVQVKDRLEVIGEGADGEDADTL